ncbi:S-layer family protein, partial [Variovorax sp. KK3]|uniref:beta strand repeat-containing protein n=1 Tax=Variovorax sp. KK3 TaxID=1855728 RepID=UPI00117E7F3D
MKLLVPSPDYPVSRFRPYYLLSPANSADRSYETCTGGGASTCQTTAMPGAWYARTDPIWAAFGVTPPAEDLPASFIGRLHPDITVGQVGVELTVDGPSGPVVLLRPFDHPVTQAEYDRWQAYRQAHQRLDVATFAFITTIAGVVRGPDGDKPSRFSSIYDAYDTTVTTSTPVLTGSAPARIVSGGAMTLHVGSGVNDMSQILAGGALTVTGGRIENRNLPVDAPTVQTGTAIHSFIIAHGSRDDERAYQVVPYSLTTNTTVALAAARLEGNVAVGGNVPSTGPFTPGQTGSAIAGPGKVPGSTVSPIVQVGTVRTSTPSTTIPTASLFTVHPEPGSRYLIETDPRFTSDAQRQRQSSDDLLRQLGIDPDAILKRLGDGYYEQRLIREQIAQLTGRRFLGGFDSDDAQFAALIDAGVTFARRYDLRPGIALTAAQMAQLTSDIVWLVEQSVTLADGSTQRVLVPQVYVRVKDGDIDGSGALLAGESVNLQLTGDLVNEGGTIAGRRVVRIDADSVHNLGGRISGDDVGIRASTDLNVIGGSVDAQRRLDVIAGRDINVVTTTREASSGVGSAAPVGARITAVTRDRVAGLYVTNPGGTLVASAGRDLNLVGGEVRSAGDAHLQAGRDVNLASITTGRSEDIRWSETNSRRGITSEETGSTVQGAGHVGITAGRDISASAATLRAGQYLSIDAGRHLTLEAGQNQRSAQTRHATKDGMSKFNLDAESQDTTLTRTTLEAQRFRLRSGGDTTLSAVEAHGQSLEIDTGGRLNLRTQSTTSAMSRKERDDDAAFASASGSGRTDETSQYNRFNVKDLSIQAT